MQPPENTHGQSDWDEQRLVQGIAARQPDARAALITASHDAVFSFACRLAPDQDLRRDWTHDCLLRIISDIESGVFQFRHPGGFWSWFRKRSWFLLLEARRTHCRRRDREIQTGGFPADQPNDGPGASCPHQDLERSEIVAAVESCLDGIEHEGQRHALRLLLLRDYTYQETAETLDTPFNTVRAWIRRGRLALRRCLARRLGLQAGQEGS